MTNEEAKRSLWLYREGIDEADPQFASALSLATGDEHLRRWLVEQDVVFRGLRAKLAEIETPADLRSRIIRRHATPHAHLYWLRPALQIAAVLVLLAVLAIAFWPRAEARNNLAAYENYITRLVSGKYRMSYESDNPESIRLFLQRNQAPSGYNIPKGLAETAPLGCATLSWSGNPVSMLCYTDARQHKLWLFVTSRQSIPDGPRTNTPSFTRQARGFVSASWTANGYTYVLTMHGDTSDLTSYL